MSFKANKIRTAISAALFAVGVLAASGADAKDWTEVRIATEGAYPPFNFVDANGQLQGFDVDIANALCEAMKAKCTLVAQDWDGIIPALIAGKFDAIVASMTITEERKKTIDFTDRYYRTPLAVIGPKDAAEDVSPEALKGKVIGAQSSTTQAEYAEKNYVPGGAELKLYPTQDEANLDLANSRLDAIIGDKFVIAEWIKKDGAECCKFLGDAPGTTSDTGIAVRKEDTDLRDKLNAAITEIRANGTYDKIRAKYFDFDIY
ncbi:ABC transporter substrate-binding protein [Chthonobacter albigriseus]|uniref:ABC transporter substrate-binding protein n=1 Tax=Chthonobacter albigriseus TaxID=1683161 RepID=UPI0015EF1959|nr:ABC transporter substrate-binding protein [Chthonobacter albigriseus]